MEDVLEKILAARRSRLKESQTKVSFDELDRLSQTTPRPLNFCAALKKKGGHLALITEIKKKSPSAGLIRSDFSALSIGMAYKQGGSDALSVLTESDFFGGRLEDLKEAKNATGLPTLRKDFILDAYQIVEARVHGADAVLLIVEALEPRQLQELVACAVSYGMEPLVEVFSQNEVEVALNSNAKLIGINTRNLRTLEMIPDNVAQMVPLIPPDRILVAESGIKGPSDLQQLRSLPVSAILVGESLLKQNDLEKAVRTLKEAA